MGKMFSNIRFYILLSSFIISCILFLWSQIVFPWASDLQVIRLEQSLGITSLFYLYIVLLIGPVCYTFPTLPFISIILKSRRALGVSVFYFALLHAIISFFGQLGGFTGLPYLDSSVIASLLFGLLGITILFLLAVTSFDAVVRKMKFRKWKLLHRFVYLAGFAVLIHAMLLGTHFTNLLSVLPLTIFFALAFLLFLEAPRLEKLLGDKLKSFRIGFGRYVFSLLFTAIALYIFMQSYKLNGTSLSIHAFHIQLAKEALQGTQQASVLPSLQGDRNLRYTVSCDCPEGRQANQDVALHFRIFNASSGNPVWLFRTVYGKPMHLIIVDSSLRYFDHIHPAQAGNTFSVTTQFPHTGLYHLYLDFQPFDAIEQQIGFTLLIGNAGQPSTDTEATTPVDSNLKKRFGSIDVAIITHGQLYADQMTLGQQTITYVLHDAKTGKPLTNLKPFMGAFGHLTMISEKTYDFIHVHPTTLTPPPPDANGGPEVDFLPIGIYGPFKPGIYRAFGEFSIKAGEDFDTDFTVKVN